MNYENEIENGDFFLQCTSLTPTPCFQQRCRNTEPGFQCLACPLGYVGTYEDALSFNISRRTFQLYNTVLDPTQAQTCSDINECLSDNGGCDANAYCTNTPVSLSQRERECKMFLILGERSRYNLETYVVVGRGLEA